MKFGQLSPIIWKVSRESSGDDFDVRILSLRFCLTQPVEIERGLPLNRRGGGEIEDRPCAFLDRAQRRHPGPPHHACIHVRGGVKAGDVTPVPSSAAPRSIVNMI